MKRKRLILLLGSLAIVALLAIGGAATVFAAGGTTTTATTKATRAQDFLNRLAGNLGITPDKLQQGLKTTTDQSIDNAVTNGKITQAQATKAKAKVDAGNGLSAFTRFFGARTRNSAVLRVTSWQDIASALNTTPQNLKTQIQAGKTLAEIIASQNKTVDQVVNAVAAKEKAQLDPAVTNGKITQLQESNLLSTLKTRLTNEINNGGPKFNTSTTPSATPSATSG